MLTGVSQLTPKATPSDNTTINRLENSEQGSDEQPCGPSLMASEKCLTKCRFHPALENKWSAV